MSDSEMDIYNVVYRKGTYYNPATSHYQKGQADGQKVHVDCDRCRRRNIPVSIGWEDYDICTICLVTIEAEHSAKPPAKRRRVDDEENDNKKK